jgi:hypothetical protein
VAYEFIAAMPEGKDPWEDQVFRNQWESWDRKDATDEYKYTEVEVEYGPKPVKAGEKRNTAKVTLKFALDGRYMFAVYGDNKHLHNQERDEWDAMAKNALEKFAGVNGFHVDLGPMPEQHNRYNYFVEFTKPIEQRPETIQREADLEKRKADLKARDDELRRLGLLPDRQQHEGGYRPIPGHRF